MSAVEKNKEKEVMDKKEAVGVESEEADEVAMALWTLNLKPLSVEECVMGWIKSGGAAGRAILPDTKKWIKNWVAYEDAADQKITAMLGAPTAFFVRRCLTAVYAGQDGQHVEAMKIMNGLLALADKELRAATGIREEYVEGTLNLLRTNRKEIQRFFGIPDGATRCKLASSPKPLDQLSNAAHAVVFGHKAVFYRYVGAKGELLESLIRKAIALDDQKQAELMHILSGVLRSRRHASEVRYRDAPDAAEIAALSNAFKLGDEENFREDVKISIAKALFDVLKQRKVAVVEIGPVVCETRLELKDKLRAMALEIGEKPGASVRALLAAALITGDRRLGYDEARDLKKSREFLDRALNLWPSNAKTLTRLGKFFLFEEKDLNTAQEKFKAAMESDKSDSVSTLSYFWIEGRSSETDALKEFCPRINAILASPSAKHWASHVLLDFAFLKGIAYMRSGVLKAGLMEWGKAQTLSNPYFMVKMFSLNSALRNNGWEMKKRAKKEGTEDEWEDVVRPMGGMDVERLLRKYFAKEQEEETFTDLADTLKNVSLARRKPDQDEPKTETEEMGKSGVVWKGSIGSSSGEADKDKDNNWRKKKESWGVQNRTEKQEGNDNGSWRRKKAVDETLVKINEESFEKSVVEDGKKKVDVDDDWSEW